MIQNRDPFGAAHMASRIDVRSTGAQRLDDRRVGREDRIEDVARHAERGGERRRSASGDEVGDEPDEELIEVLMSHAMTHAEGGGG